MSVLLLNSTGETFTPTRSGAIATWIWEVCREADRDGVQPLVITRAIDAEPHPWPNTVFLKYPSLPTIRGTGLGRLIRIHQKLSGWAHPRQKAYAVKVARAIRDADAQDMPMVLQNDPEMAVFLRQQFPKAFILHHSQNAYACSERFRGDFAAAADVHTSVSEYCARWNEEYYRIPTGSVRVLYNGVNTERFCPADALPEGDPVINFIGRTDSQKAPDLLLRAAKKLTGRTRSFGVQILGARFYWGASPDAYQSLLTELTQELEQDGIAVRRPGLVTRHALPDELRKAHIHTVPSRWDDPCPLTTLEGMACGLPIVASRTGGTPEIVGDAGFLFERDSLEGLTDHLHALVEDPRMRVEYGRKARARAQQFSWARTWRELKALLP